MVAAASIPQLLGGHEGLHPCCSTVLLTLQEIPSPGHQTPPKTSSPTQVHCLPHHTSPCPSTPSLGWEPQRTSLPSNLSLQPQRTKHPPPIFVRVCEAPAHPGTSWNIRIPLPGSPPSTSQTSGGRAALQGGTSQARIILVSCYLGISSALYLLKRLFRSHPACPCGLTAAMDTGWRNTEGTVTPPCPQKHRHQTPWAQPGLDPDQGKSLHNYNPICTLPHCSSSFKPGHFKCQGRRMAAPSSSPRTSPTRCVCSASSQSAQFGSQGGWMQSWEGR